MLGENVKKLRKKMNLSRAQLGQNIGLTGRNIEFIENGKNKNPTLQTLKKFSDFFEVSIDYIIK